MKTANTRPLRRAGLALALCCCASGAAHAGATITIVNLNAPGVGFNDPTPLAAVGGNSGTTLGAQRRIAFEHAAGIWGRTLTSTVPIRIGASFVPLACSADSAVLGAAGANGIEVDFPGAPKANTWYPSALASKLSGVDQSPGEPHIVARFNSRLGLFADCMPGSGFYLGLDAHPGAKIDLVTVLLHEMAHGLGFQTFTDAQSGRQTNGIASVWDHFLLDTASNKLWVEMSDSERAASAVSGKALSWNGAQVRAVLPTVLGAMSTLAVSGPAAGNAAGNYDVGDAAFGAPLGYAMLSAELMPVQDQPGGGGLACAPLSAANRQAVKGHIALVDRGACAFSDKAWNVQDAGALGMLVADNAPGEVAALGGSDARIKIPSLRISQQAGVALRTTLLRRSRSVSGVVASVGLNVDRLAGADPANRIRMYTPTEFSPGSSVSHYSIDARPNQLMEPSINADLTHAVDAPYDLTFPVLQDIGW
jgi:hypothetical protein